MKRITLFFILQTIAWHAFCQTSEASPWIEFSKKLTGEWQGTGLGGESDEIWLNPVEGKMSGIFRQVSDGKVMFYEIFTLDSAGLTLKHFDNSLNGWEEKNDHVYFPVLEITGNEIIFEGMKYTLVDINTLEATVELESDGKKWKETFRFRRR